MSLLTPNSNLGDPEFRAAASTGIASRRTTAPAFRLDPARSLRMHPRLAAGVTVLTFMLLLTHAFTTKPMYLAEALVYVQPAPVRLLGPDLSAPFDSARYDSFLQEQMQQMQRPETILAAIGSLPRSVWAEYGPTQQQATEGIQAKLNVARITTSYQVTVTLKGSNPGNVTRLVNTIIDTYLHLLDKQTLTENGERADLLEQERQRVASELRTTQKEQSELAANLGVANPNGEIDPYEGELASLHEQLVQARSARDAAAVQFATLSTERQGTVSALAAAADEAIKGDTELSTLKSTISERRATLSGQMSGMTPDNPLRQRSQEQLADLDHSLEELTARLHAKAEHTLKEKLGSELQRTKDLEARVHAQLAQRTATATHSTPKLQRAAELSLGLKRLLLRQAEIDDASRSLQLEISSPGLAHLSSPAQIPTKPERNPKRLFLMASLPLGLLFGLIAAEAARVCNQKIYTRQDLEDAGGFVPLAILSACEEISESALNADLLRMAASIESAHRTKGLHTFLFTSVSPQTDSEWLCRCLLEKLEQMGVHACKRTTSELILPTAAATLVPQQILSSSRLRETAFSSDHSAGFVHENLSLLQDHHGLVLIEASTLSDSAEAEYVARCTSAVILIAHCAVTTKVELQRAAELLRRLQVPAVGIVLQDIRLRSVKDGTRSLLNTVDGSRMNRQLSSLEQLQIVENQRAMTSSPESKAVLQVPPKEVEAPETLTYLSAFESPLQQPAENEAPGKDGSEKKPLSSELPAGEFPPAFCNSTDIGTVSSSRWKLRSHRVSSPHTSAATPSKTEEGPICPLDNKGIDSPPVPILVGPSLERSTHSRDSLKLTPQTDPRVLCDKESIVSQPIPFHLSPFSTKVEEQGQEIQHDSRSVDTESSDFTDIHTEHDSSSFGLTSGTRDDHPDRQQLGGSAEHMEFRDVETFNQRVGQSGFDESSFPGTDRWHPIPALRPTEQKGQSPASHAKLSVSPNADPASLQAEQKFAAGVPREESFESDCMLTRQWSLLSRFQQASGLPDSARSPEQTGRPTPQEGTDLSRSNFIETSFN